MYEKIYLSGFECEPGNYACTNCGFKITPQSHQILPFCPICNNYEFTKEKG